MDDILYICVLSNFRGIELEHNFMRIHKYCGLKCRGKYFQPLVFISQVVIYGTLREANMARVSEESALSDKMRAKQCPW